MKGLRGVGVEVVEVLRWLLGKTAAAAAVGAAAASEEE